MTFKTSLLAVVALLAFNPMFAGDKDAPDGTRKLLDPANVDPAVKPGDNFFYYANGSWLKKNPVPGSETRWGSFNELLENNYASLHQLLDMAAENKNAEKGSPQQKVGDFYRTGMDEDAIKKAGLKPLQSIFKRIDAINAPEELLQEIALEHTEGITPLFNFYVSPDDKNVTKQVPQFSQGGLGMPDRDYYFNTDERTVKIKDAYKGYLNRMLKSIGSKEPQRMADMIFNLETQLAEASMTRVEMRDPYKLYNKYSLRQLNETSQRGFNWALTFRRLKIREADSLIIGQPEFFAKAGELLNKMPLEVWKEYLKFHVVNDMAPYLSNEFDELHFDFYGRTLRGQQEQKPRWKRVLQVVDNSIGEVLGQMYVDKYFKPEAKERMVELVTNLQTTYADRINRLSWMSNPTKKKALAKLNTFMKKIGYPDNWRDYSRLQITPDSYVENILNAAAFDYNYNLSKLGRPVDRSEWGMTPPTVNAYYNPAFNEIVFPAGILQYPFFEMSGDDAVNYGGIGAVIGHEMTHGFDDQGRQYDDQGNLNDWWIEADSKNFDSRAKKVVKQFNGYTVLDTVHVNGELTLGENLADLGGMAIAYEAFKKTPQGKNGKTIDGYTPDQRFFLSWAQVWRANTRPEELASRIITDPHSPSEWRCNGPLTNFDAWYKAFNIKPSDKMYKAPADRVQIW